MNNNELVREILKMAGFDNPIEKDTGGITYHKDRSGVCAGRAGRALH